VDLDGDGRRDILSGSYSRHDVDMAGLFQVLYGQPDGTFRKAEVLKGTDGEPLIIPHDKQTVTEAICTRPFAVDWDGDSHLDLVVGNFKGTFYWFRGEGQGKFQPKPEAIKTGDQPLHVEGGYHGDPFAIDWDGDGDLDLLSGSSKGGVQWAENIAGAGKLPELRPFVVLIKPEGLPVEERELVTEETVTGPTKSTRVWAADVNGDGKLDLLVGDDVTLSTPVKGLSADQFKKKYADWKKSFEKASQDLSSNTLDQAKRTKAQEKLNRVYEQRSEFMTEEDTGFVWLYLQK
jgi:FG-GAP-like repeat